MPDWQLKLIAGLCVAAFLFRIFLWPMLTKDTETDDMDKAAWRLKKSRAEKGLCIYCGQKLDSQGGTAFAGSDVCASCMSAISPE
jgi:hypothetical protein